MEDACTGGSFRVSRGLPGAHLTSIGNHDGPLAKPSYLKAASPLLSVIGSRQPAPQLQSEHRLDGVLIEAGGGRFLAQ